MVDDIEVALIGQRDHSQAHEVAEGPREGDAGVAENHCLEAMLELLEQPGGIGRLIGHGALEPADHAGIAPMQRIVGQGTLHVAVLGAIAQVLQRHGQVAMRIVVGELAGLGLGLVVEHQHAARHRFDEADADLIEHRHADPGNEALGIDASGDVTGEL